MKKKHIGKEEALKKQSERKVAKLIYTPREKGAYNMEVVRGVVDFILGVSTRTAKETAEMIEHLNLLSGSWPEFETSDYSIKIPIAGESDNTDSHISIGRKYYTHYPLIDQPNQKHVEGLMNINYKYDIKDMSEHSLKFREKRETQKLKKYLRDRYWMPYYKKAVDEVNASMGKTVPEGIQEEEFMQQKQFQINQKMNQYVDPNLLDQINSIRSPNESIVRKMMEYTYSENDLDMEFFKGAYYNISTGKEFYWKRFNHNILSYSAVNPVLSDYILSSWSPKVENGIFFKHRRFLTPVELISEAFLRYGMKTVKELDAMMQKMPDGYTTYSGDTITHNLTGSTQRAYSPNSFQLEVENPGGVVTETGNFVPNQLKRNPDGSIPIAKDTRKFIVDAYNKGYGIPVDHVTWRWLEKGKEVFRDFGGEEYSVLRSYHYKKSEANGDIRVSDAVYPRTWECQYFDGNYMDLGQVECQDENPFDMSRPKLSVYGSEINNFDKNVENSSIMKSSVPFQRKYNLLMDSLFDKIMEDPGVVTFLKDSFANSKYGGIEGFFNMLYTRGLVLYGEDEYTKNEDVRTKIQSVNMSKTADISKLFDLLNYMESQINKFSNSNAYVQGLQGQYANRMNIQSGMQSYRKGMYRTLRMSMSIRESVLRSVMHSSVYAYSMNPTMLRAYLNDVEYAYFVENKDEILGSPMKFKLLNNYDDEMALAEYKALMKNKMAVSTDSSVAVEIAELMKASTMSEAVEIAERYLKDRRLYEDKIQDRQAEIRREEIEAENERVKYREDREDARNKENNKIKREAALFKSMQMANAYDIDKNSIPDHVQRTIRERESIERVKELERKLELIKHKDKMALEEKKLSHSKNNS